MSDNPLIDLLKGADPDDPNKAMTSREIAAALGMGMDMVRERIREKIEAGEIEAVKVRRLYINGNVNISYGYRVRTR